MLLTFKILLQPTIKQQDLLKQISDEGRLLYNYFLNQKIEHYKKTSEYLNYFIQQKELKNYQTNYLTYDIKKEILRNLDHNYKSFFQLIKSKNQDNCHTPKFRSNKYWFTLSYVQDFIVKNNEVIISLPNRKRIELKLNYLEPIADLICKRGKTKESDIKQLKIIKENDRFYACIVYDKKEETNTNNEYISIDLGKKNLATIYDKKLNEAIIYDSTNLNKNQKHYDKRIDELKSKRDKKQEKSNRQNKLNNKIKKLYQKRKIQNKLILHKLSKELSDKNIVIGELTNLKRNIKTNYKKVNRQLQNNWNLTTFVHLLEYKTKLKGNQVIKVNEAWTSKTCSNCGSIINNLTLSDRNYSCDCGLNIDRDVNGAINILKKYLGDYNTPIEIDYDKLSISKRYNWSNFRCMNKFA